MKNNIFLIAVAFLAGFSCSKKELDRIYKNLNDAEDVQAANELPAVIVESSFGTTGTDIAWYSSVFVEQSAGIYGQLRTADTRTGANVPSLFNNNWNALYDNLMILKDIIDKTSPDGSEPNNKIVLGIAQVLTAYNLAIATDMWGQVPWSEALMGMENPQPKYDKQQDIYKNVLFKYLNDAIENFSYPVAPDNKTLLSKQDLIYGGDAEKWTKAAWSLKARYFMHMQKVVPTAVDSALACIPNGFADASDALIFNKYEESSIGENPWYQFLYDRSYLGVGKTLYEIMSARNDPRIEAYFVPMDDQGTIVPAPNGTAVESFSGDIYSYSRLTDEGRTAATPLMTYHELLFIQAEALARKGGPAAPILKKAISESFAYHGIPYQDIYFTQEVAPRLGTSEASQLAEIMTQKYISAYEFESIESYNDYRRTRIPQLNNPNNTAANYGFVERFPYPTSEVSNNGSNVPAINVFKDKVWWAGGTE